jgi:predicted metal-binding membrane protein
MSTASQPAPAAVREAPVYVAAGAVFLATAALTLYFARAMAGGMPMPGGWTMSMMWMVMPGQPRLSAALVFIAMWAAMMVAMMLPSTLPLLLLYRRVALFRGEARVGFATALLAAAYFFVWTLFGVLAYFAGSAMARLAMSSASAARSIPPLTGVALLVAGLYQLTPWKYACLRHCRDPLLLVARHLGGGWRGALRLGLHHGSFCAACCWALMLIQLVVGIMSIPAMVAVAAVIATEKLLRRGEWVARAVGVAALLAGAAVLFRSLR